MNVDHRINLNVSQRLVMTPMLQQAIKLLQMSRLELVDLVQQEMLENPVLEELEENDEPRSEDQEYASQEEPSASEESERPENSIDWEDYFTDNPASLGYHGEYGSDEDNQTYDNVMTRSQTLAEHLTWQLQMSKLSERELRIGQFLIGQIDDEGYLRSEDLPDVESVNIHDPLLKPGQARTYRAAVARSLAQKINAEFEREHLTAHVQFPENQQNLADVLLQEYYDELTSEAYQPILTRLEQLTIEDIETLLPLLTELPLQEIETVTGIPAEEIQQGFRRIAAFSDKLRAIIGQYWNVLLRESYEVKLEKLEMTPEELFFLEFLLSKLGTEEVDYIASRENPEQNAKREEEVQNVLEKLRQSYSHVESLKSHKYFLIQLYCVGIRLLPQILQAGTRLRKKHLLKIQSISEQDVVSVAQHIQQERKHYYTTHTPVSAEDVEDVLRDIHTFDPSGVGARDIKECLCIQARNLGISGTVVLSIISTSLHDLQQKQYKRIAEKLEIPVEEVELAQPIIAGMSPRPGADFTGERPEYIIPDLYVYRVGDDYEVVLNEDDLPTLRVNSAYKNIILRDQKDTPDATKQYVDQKLRSAIWFIRSVEQRKRTIHKVGQSIVKFQREFLEYGISYLKPMVLRDVADDIAMHESTVSRVTTNKYIHTPQGVFELKFFFHSGLESSSGDDISSIAIKRHIKQLIDEEDPKRPLSDKAIEKNLNKTGIAIARRTIAKYREELNIPSSVQRKRLKT